MAGRHEQFDLEDDASTGWSRARFLHFMNVSVRHKYLYCPTPKVACSSILLTLQRFELQDSTLAHDPWSEVHYREFSPLLTPLQVPDFWRWLHDAGTFKFCFVRNPYDRLLSTYLDKVVLGDELRAKFHAALGREGSISFDDFIDVVVNEPAEDMDAHYAIQCRHTFQSRVPYDYIGRFEHLADGLAEIARHIGMDLQRYEARIDPHKTGPKTYGNYYTSRTVRLVQHKFAEDFEVFDYPLVLPD